MTASDPVRFDKPDTPDEPSIGTLVSDAAAQMSTLVRAEVELAKAEIGTAAKNAGLGVGLFVGTLVLVVFASIFGFIALAEGLVAAHIWRWAAYLIVFGFLIVVAVLFALVGLRYVKKIKAPQRTIETTKDTVAVLRHPGAN
ncbi:phage holin family protein [Jatrophihabitans sp. YIM 134969]